MPIWMGEKVEKIITYHQYGKLFDLSDEKVDQLRGGVVTTDPRIVTEADGRHLVIERIDDSGRKKPYADQLLTPEQLQKIETF